MPEVLFATIAAGGGHVATARAMAEAVSEVSGGALTVRVSDAMAEYGPKDLDERHKASWRALLARPRLVRASQAVMDAAPTVSRRLQNAVLRGFVGRISAALRDDPPAVIVVNHGWLATAMTQERVRSSLGSRVVVYATEPFDASALWSAPNAETVLAPSTAAAQDLVRLGVPARAVHVAGYPVARRFREAPPKHEARAALGIADGPVVLLSLGAEGVAAADAVAAAVEIAGSGVTVLCVTGRNQDLARELASAAEGAGVLDRVRPLGFVERMEVPLSACDLVVGKAGPASTMEALAVGRPVIVAAYAGLNELAVVRFLEASGTGANAGSWGALPRAVDAWLAHPERLDAAARSAAVLDFDAMTVGIGRFLGLMASNGHADPALLEPGAMEGIAKSTVSGRPAVPGGYGA